MAGVPYVFGNATTSIPLSDLDANFNTGVTIGNTTVGLGNTVTTLGNVTLNNATVSSTATALPYAALPTGTVLQVINATYSTGTSTTSATLADTGLTATITPRFSTSKILVLVHQNGGIKVGNVTYPNSSIALVLLRGASAITTIAARNGLTTLTTDLYTASMSTAWLDSPATTSATTYKTQYANFQAGGTVYLQLAGETSTITLMEIAG